MNDTISSSLLEALNLAIQAATTYGLDAIGAILTLIVGWWLAGRIRGWVNRALERADQIDAMLRGFLANAARHIVLIVTVLAVLDRFGVETTSFIAIIGAAGLAIGLALQGTLSSVAAGVMILLFRPFNVGDFIEGGGQTGTVKSVSLVVTHLNTPDNVEIIVPNNRMWNTSIQNYSHNDTRRLDLTFGIGYGDDIDQALDVLKDIVCNDDRALADPEALFAVGELADNSVNLIVRVWCARGDYFGFKCDLLKAVKQRFDAEGISFPYPQRDVHIIAGGPVPD